MKDKKNQKETPESSLGFLTVGPDGRIIGNCFITPEEGAKIREMEGVIDIINPFYSDSKPTLLNKDYRESLIESVDPERRNIAREILERKANELSETESTNNSTNMPFPTSDFSTRAQNTTDSPNEIFNKLWAEYIATYPGMLSKDWGYVKSLKEVIKDTADALNKQFYSGSKRPILLLGNVQSGKTQAFEKIMGLCFDKGFDLCIVLTKNSLHLLNQTIDRIGTDFNEVNNPNADKVGVLKIGQRGLQNKINDRIEIGNKVILFSLKEKKNLEKLVNLDFQDKKVLIIDDEADIVSDGFKKTRDGIKIAKCAELIRELREKCQNAYLQVTATAYNLLLQPLSEPTALDAQNKSIRVMSSNPDKIFILPKYPDYKGFNEYLNRKQRTIENWSVNNSNYEAPLLAYLMASAILRGKGIKRTSAIIHVDTKRGVHNSIFSIINQTLTNIRVKINNSNPYKLFDNLYNDFINNSGIPTKQAIIDEINKSITDVITVNNNQPVRNLIQNASTNIYIGGYMLDRGLTFPNLITFVYGRKSLQHDTVIQHARFFGNRSVEEVALTRLFMPKEKFEMMKKMHQADEKLRDIIRFTMPGERWKVLKEKGKTVVCSKYKILLSQLSEERSEGIIAPTGMWIDNNYASGISQRVIQQVKNNKNPDVWDGNKEYYKIQRDNIINILKVIKQSYIYNVQYDNLNHQDDIDRLIDLLNSNPNYNYIWTIIYQNRDLSRKNAKNGFQGANQILTTGNGNNTDKSSAKKISNENNSPVLVLTHQNGDTNKGWSGVDFLWPVVVLPSNDVNKITIQAIN